MNITNLIEEIVNDKFRPQTFIGKAINVTDSVCDVERVDLPTIEDVRLQSVVMDKTEGLILKPKEGSFVIGQFIEQSETNAFLTSVSEIEFLKIKHGKNTHFEITENGVIIENGTNNLSDLIGKFIDEVAKIIVIQGTTPNVPKLTEIKTNIQKILK